MLNRNYVKKLTTRGLLVFLSCPVLSPLLLASFTVLSGYMTMNELKLLLTAPLSTLLTLSTILIGVVMAIVPVQLFARKYRDRDPSWDEIKYFNYQNQTLPCYPGIFYWNNPDVYYDSNDFINSTF